MPIRNICKMTANMLLLSYSQSHNLLHAWLHTEILTRNSMTGGTRGAGTAYTSRSPEFTCCFSITQYLVFCVVFCPPIKQKNQQVRRSIFRLFLAMFPLVLFLLANVLSVHLRICGFKLFYHNPWVTLCKSYHNIINYFCLILLSIIFQLCRCDQFSSWRKPE